MTLAIWAGFLLALAGVLALDLGLGRAGPRRAARPGEAAISGLIWLALAVGASIAIGAAYHYKHLGFGESIGTRLRGTDAALQFIASYLAEAALSLDNIAVLALLLGHFRVRDEALPRVLFWTLCACMAARAALIAGFGAVLHLAWTPYALGGLLLVALFRTLFMPDEHTAFEGKRLVRLAHWAGWHGREVTPGTAGEGRGMTVPAIAVVAAVGDLSFAADSIPAAFAVTHDPVIALTSNLLALATLRSLYFALRGVIGRFRYLKLAIVLMLIVLTGKILHNDFSIVPTLVTLGAMVAILLGAMLGSLRRRFDPGTMRQAHPTPIEDITDAALATRRNVRKIAILIAGTSIIFCGILIAPLPGPGPVVLVPIGLGVLATEFVWAKLLLDRLKAQTASMQRHADVLSVRSPLWLVPLVVVAFWGLAAYLAHAGPFAPWKIYVPAGGMFIPIGYWAIKTVQAKLRRGHKDAGPGEPR